MDVQMLKTLAHKLGLTSPRVVRKAEELIRLLAVQGGTGLALSMSGKAVICLEIAATLASCSFDKTLAVRLSGLTRPQYVASSQTVSRLLNVSSSVCVADLCVTHSATAARDLAAKVLKQYEAEKIQGQVDIALPVYQTAAVIAACKVMKIKVDKRRMFETSRSKRAVYDKVVEGMTKVAESLHSEKATKSGGTKRGKTLMDMVEDNLRNESPEKKTKVEAEEKDDNANDKEADFEEWKRKILEAAAAAE
ncbi:origin recognition complex subunit 6-like [Penaeus indicus]|uniref:origin recognition complex subunit 6-like n=1 Tax=Penaeus indicus TaxID=29960 RepID=UPI00300CD3D7